MTTEYYAGNDQRVQISFEQERECGFREIGGVYLRGARQLGMTDSNMPLPLASIMEGFQVPHSMGWERLVNPSRFWDHIVDPNFLLYGLKEDAILTWVGEQYYSPAESIAEAEELQADGLPRGFSRRVNFKSLPEGVVPGKTWVLLAHIKGMTFAHWKERAEQFGFDVSKHEVLFGANGFVHAIFSAFILDRVEYILSGDETQEEVDAIVAKGFSPVIVRPVDNEGYAVDYDEATARKAEKAEARKAANRKNAGRPKGALGKKTLAKLAAQAASQSELPLDENESENESE